MLDWRKNKLKRIIQESRYRLLNMHGDFINKLYDLTYIATKDVWRISTDGNNIYFDPDWLQKLEKRSLDYILLHELLHITFGHIDRPAYYRGDKYHFAADIIVNGHLSLVGWGFERLPGIGKIRYETFLPQPPKHGSQISIYEAMEYTPLDPSVLTPGKRRQFMIDSEDFWEGNKQYEGEVILRPSDRDPENLVYDGPTCGKTILKPEINFRLRKHDEYWDRYEEDSKPIHDKPKTNEPLNRVIRKLRIDLFNSERKRSLKNNEREWEETNAQIIDWKSMLDSFVQEEVNDYSFMPPDRRMNDLDFFLPDFNEYSETARDVIFMVDTSGSITDEMLSVAYMEIKQAIEQFNGKLKGEVAFFDTTVKAVYPFEKIDDIAKMKPIGGGGTRFECVFNFLKKHNNLYDPTSIVIITDGEGDYPNGEAAMNLPVLWLIAGGATPPFGKVARI